MRLLRALLFVTCLVLISMLSISLLSTESETILTRTRIPFQNTGYKTPQTSSTPEIEVKRKVGLILSNFPDSLESDHVVGWMNFQFSSRTALKSLDITVFLPKNERLTSDLINSDFSIVNTTCEASNSITMLNCLGSALFESGIEYLGLVDVQELYGEKVKWVYQSIISVENAAAARTVWIENVRQNRIAGRGIQFGRKITETKFSNTKYSPWHSELWKDSTVAKEGEYWSKLPFIQFTGSFVIHKSHYEALGTIFDISCNSLPEGLLWLSHSYSQINTDLIASPSKWQLETVELHSTSTGNFSVSSLLYEAYQESRRKLMEYKVELLLNHYEIGSCETFDSFYEITEFAPLSYSHSSKSHFKTGYTNETRLEKLFIYENAQGGREVRRESNARNIFSLLMLQHSPLTPRLISYCPKSSRTAVEFISSTADFKGGFSHFDCESRIVACIELVRSLQLLKSIGGIQCDWKESQWIFDEQNSVRLVDVDRIEMVPTDCGQSKNRNHDGISNFHIVMEGMRAWNRTETWNILDEQFLTDTTRGTFYTYDYRHDIYRLGGSKYFSFILDYHGACELCKDQVKDLILDINSLYPPTLQEIINRLLDLKDNLAKVLDQ